MQVQKSAVVYRKLTLPHRELNCRFPLFDFSLYPCT
jgi:hypothetical protein